MVHLHHKVICFVTISMISRKILEIVDEDDVAVDMQAFAKEKSRRMMQK